MDQTELGRRIQESFARQGLMRSLGARLVEVDRGRVVIEVPYADTLTQQNGYFHAAVSAAIGDTAGGYAAYTLMDPSDDVLAVEFKINLLAPARAESFLACGRVLRAGRTLTVCQAEVFTAGRDARTLVAVMLSTLIVRPMAQPGS